MPPQAFTLTKDGIRDLRQIKSQFANPLPEVIDSRPGDRNWQIVTISSGTANGDGTYSGYWVLTASGTPENQQTIRIKNLGGQVLVTGQYYLAYFSHYDETNHVGVFLVPDAVTVGYTGTVTEERDVWTGCSRVHSTRDLVYVNGLLISVGSWA